MYKSLVSFLLIVSFLFSCSQQKRLHVAKLDDKDTPYYDFIHADLLAMEGQTAKSMQELVKLVGRFPDIAFFHYLLAQNYGRERRLKEATESCKKAVELSPDFLDARIYLGKLASASDKHGEAERIFLGIIRDDPKREETYIILAGEQVILKEYPLAVKTLKSLLTVNPDAVIAYYYLGIIYDRHFKNSAGAYKMYNSALQIDPTNVSIHNALGELYLRNKQIRKALEKFKEVVHLEPDDITTQLKVALIHYELREYSEAIAIFEDILKENPNADKIRFYLGVLYETQKEIGKAAQEFALIPSNSGYYKDARLHMASLARLAGQNDDAVLALREAIRAKNQVPEFYEYLAAIYEDVKDYKSAIDVLEDGHNAIPQDEKIVFLLGVLYEKVEDRKSAVEAMRDVLKINPKNAGALNYIGYTYAEKGENLEEAVEMIEQALVIRPDDGYITDSLGWAYFKLGELDLALKNLLKASSLTPGETTILYHIGEAYLKKGDTKNALKYFEQALAAEQKKAEPDERELNKIIGKINEIKGR